MRTLRIATILAVFTVGPAVAQDQGGPPPGYQSAPPSGYQGGPPPAHEAHAKLRTRFDQANTTHDGRLTRDQAERAGLKVVSKHFDEIDTTHKGYVTFDQVKAYRHAMSAAHHHAGNAPPPADQQSGY